MLVARMAHSRWAVYLTAVLINAALYLWIPTVHQKTGLLQLYVIPAALTVLIFTHLHRGDLNRQAVTGIRFAASAAILAVSTFEVFTTDSLLHFVVVLVLSLLLAFVGVALRVRPFVYIGSAFLVIQRLGPVGTAGSQPGRDCASGYSHRGGICGHGNHDLLQYQTRVAAAPVPVVPERHELGVAAHKGCSLWEGSHVLRFHPRDLSFRTDPWHSWALTRVELRSAAARRVRLSPPAGMVRSASRWSPS